MQREIGSNFWLNPNEHLTSQDTLNPDSLGLQGNDYVFTSTGRGALKLVLHTIRERVGSGKLRAMLPPFTCHTVVEPFIQMGCDVSHYPLNMDFTITAEQLQQAVEQEKPHVLLLHRYFGFNTLPGCHKTIENIRNSGVFVIEDLTQCLYSWFAPVAADFYVGSLRKWAAVPDGGFAICREGQLAEHPVRSDKILELAKLEASFAKYEYMEHNIGEKAVFLKKYREAEDILSNQTKIYAISPVSVSVQKQLDIERLTQKRRSNANVLLDGITNLSSREIVPAFNKIQEDVVPLYIPIWVSRNREKFQRTLAESNIYAPIVWPRASCVLNICQQAEMMYTHLLCIPIDQRYDRDDMERIVDTMQNYLLDCQG